MKHLEVLKRLPKEKEGEIAILNIIEGVQGDDRDIEKCWKSSVNDDHDQRPASFESVT